MKTTKNTYTEWFLRIALSTGFLSAVADRFGLWPAPLSIWGNYAKFLEYTKQINPLFPESSIPFLGGMATLLEIAFGLLLLVNFKTKQVAQASGVLLLFFGLAMTFSVNAKAPLDYSVFTAAAAAFALSALVDKKQEA